MKIRVLGSAAGGGFPQWNCNCSNCSGLRNGTLNAVARTQSSIALSIDAERWVIFNASPDIRSQLESFPAIQPRRGLRDTGIHAIVLVDSQIDHTTGLLLLREGCPLTVYATDMVHQDLTTGFPVFRMLDSWNGGIDYHQLPTDGSSFQFAGAPHLVLTAVPLVGKAPPYSPHRHDAHVGDNIGVLIEDKHQGSRLFYAPGLGAVDQRLLDIMKSCDCLLLDGTFWREDEMLVTGVGTKMAAEMGHLPQSGPGGLMEILEPMAEQRKVLIHINNTNPILIEDSPERELLTQAGIEVSYDGMEIELGGE